jgi:hypothetical protein
MGRPLNKKYFANTNYAKFGSANVGGEGVASISTATVGSININDTYKYFPTLTVAAPTITGGVTATTTVTWEIDTVVLTGGTGWTAGAITSMTGSIWDDADVKPAFTVTVALGVPTFGAFTNRGSFTNINGTGITTWATNQTGAVSAQATVKFRVKSIAMSNVGSGYTSAPSLSWTSLGGTTPSGQTPTLTSGGSARQNGIKAETQYGSGDSEIVTGDIVKQESSRTFKVQTSQGTGVFKLVTTEAKNAGEMSIKATDSDGGTYLVSKISSRRVTLVPTANANGGSSSAGTQFASGTMAKWTFGSAVENETVTIDNQ